MVSTFLTKCVALGLAANICSTVESAATQYGIPMAVFAAIVKVESNFEPGAINDLKPGVAIASYGLGQLTLDTAKYHCNLTKDLILNAKKNAQCAAKVFSYQLKRYSGDVIKAIAAYNAGTAFLTPEGKPRNQAYVELVQNSIPAFEVRSL